MTDSANNAKKYSFKLLSYRERSESELRERLIKQGFPDNIIYRTIAFLKKAGYLNEKALAVSLKRQALSNKLLGYNAAKALMLKRGVPLEIIQSTLDYDEDREVYNAKKLMHKKFTSMGNYVSIQEKRKLWNFLARRGYSFTTIEKVLKNYRVNEEER